VHLSKLGQLRKLVRSKCAMIDKLVRSSKLGQISLCVLGKQQGLTFAVRLNDVWNVQMYTKVVQSLIVLYVVQHTITVDGRFITTERNSELLPM
jgi:hypothetical protein